MGVEFDALLESIGSFGRYQKYAIFLFLLPVSFFNAFMVSQLLFQLMVPDHWCHVPGRETTGLTRDQWRGFTIPRSGDLGKHSSCLMYTITWSGDVIFSPSESGDVIYSPSEGGDVIYSPSEGGDVIYSPSEGGDVIYSPSEGGDVIYSPSEGGDVIYSPSEGGDVIYSPSEGGDVIYSPSEDVNASFSLSHDTEECRSGWEYDSSQMASTVATSNEWYCERETFSHHLLSVNNAGNAFGTLILPLIGDKYTGRRVVLYVALLTHVVFTAPLVWISNFGFQLVFRFLAGLGYLTFNFVPYVIVVEIVSSKRRALVTGLFYGAWIAGMCATAPVAFLARHWQNLALLSCLPPLLVILFLRFVPESPLWLLSRGRVAECATIILQIAKTNGRPLVSRQDLETRLNTIAESQEEQLSIWHALSYPKLRLRLVLVSIISICIYMSHGVTLMGINILPHNIFLSFFILSASQFPGMVGSWASLQYLGRRFSTMSCSLLSVALCSAASFCLHDEWLLMLVIGALRLCQMMLIQAMFVVLTEILPTPIRSSGLGLYNVFGLLSMIFSPYILHSGMDPGFHYWVMAVLMLIAFILCIPLPETLGLALPQTFQEAEHLGAGRPVFTWIHNWNVTRYPTTCSKTANSNNTENPTTEKSIEH
ncbi:solute carrier family 22 member 21-like [Procambarus clarkii]|uniref:solute carrier family 22 member 21-like n=1 Tax=Procambarus clarkii TaxID=6728 RepID=UPI0037435944